MKFETLFFIFLAMTFVLSLIYHGIVSKLVSTKKKDGDNYIFKATEFEMKYLTAIISIFWISLGLSFMYIIYMFKKLYG